MLKINTRFNDPFWVLEFHGNLLEKEVGTLKNILTNQLEEGHIRIALDLSRITQACSLSLGVIVKLWKSFSAKNGKIVILKPPLHIQNLFKETKLDTVVPVIEEESQLKNL